LYTKNFADFNKRMKKMLRKTSAFGENRARETPEISIQEANSR
jgi:hypothetical protein